MLQDLPAPPFFLMQTFYMYQQYSIYQFSKNGSAGVFDKKKKMHYFSYHDIKIQQENVAYYQNNMI